MSDNEFQVKIGDETRTVKIVRPNGRVQADADIYASKVFASLIKQRDKDGKPAFLVRSNLDSYLKDIGLFTDQDIENIGKYGEKIGDLEEKLNKGGITKKSGRDIAIELRRVRLELLMLFAKRADYDKHTVEAYAENARYAYIITKCLLFEDDEPIFCSVDDYENDTDLQEALSGPINRLRTMISLYDPDFEAKLIENRFLLKYGFCNDKYELVDSEGRRVNENGDLLDANGNPITDEETALTKEVGEFLDD